MISQTIRHGTKVFHEVFGFGTFKGFESRRGTYYGFALVEFDTDPRLHVISPKKLTEIEDE